MMSSKEVINRTLTVLKKVPGDKLKHYASFKDSQIARYESPEVAQYTSDQLKTQLSSIIQLYDNKYSKLYPTDVKLSSPKGNPNYYKRLLNDIGENKKEGFFKALRFIYSGKY